MSAVRGVTPYLIIDGAASAIDWYREVFGPEEVSRMTGGAGRIAHAEIRIGAKVRDPWGHGWLLTRAGSTGDVSS